MEMSTSNWHIKIAIKPTGQTVHAKPEQRSRKTEQCDHLIPCAKCIPLDVQIQDGAGLRDLTAEEADKTREEGTVVLEHAMKAACQ